MKTVSLLSVLAIILLSSCAPQTAAPTPDPIQPLIEENTVSASARVVPLSYVSLGFINGAGQVEMLVSQGDPVRAGQVLARGDRRALEIALAQAQAGLRQAQAALTLLQNQPAVETVKAAEAALINAEYNVDRAIDRGAIRLELAAVVAARDSAQANLDAIKAGPSPEQVDSAAAAVALAQSSVDLAQLSLDQSEIIAPFDGVIVAAAIRNGENASPGTPIIILADLTQLRLETTDMSEIDTARIAEGMPVKISIDAFPGKEYAGAISRIALRSEAGSGTNYTVEIVSDELPTGLRWGMSAFIVIDIP